MIIILELKKITKDYKTNISTTTVLKGINLTFRKSEFVSILGPSGCGKTTMLNIIGGLDKYTSGDLVINCKSTKEYKDQDWDTYRNHTIGFVFQSYNLIPHQTILKNVELALSIGGIKRAERVKLAKEALIKVGLEEHMHKRPNQLSGGQCQRVSIARALVGNPDIILADEPTGALDSETSVSVMELLKEIAKDRLVIMVTHNPDLALKYSTRIVKMLDGTIMDDSNPVSTDEYNELVKECEEIKNTNNDTVDNKKKKKASMNVGTCIGLSASNLGTKKRRTAITALASSIGIIGIAVILSVSNGMQSYVNVLQADSSSSNMITISSTSTTSSFGLNKGGGPSDNSTSELEEYPSGLSGVYVYSKEKVETTIKNQILSNDYINYLDTNINNQNLALGISYTRGVNINLVTEKNSTYVSVGTSSWTEIMENSEYIATQYTTLATSLSGNSIPTEANQVVLVVDKYNRVSTDILDSLGIDYSSDTTMINYTDLLGKTFKLASNDNYYYKEPFGEKYIYRSATSQDELKYSYDNGYSVEIVSILREKEDASSSWISTGIGYTEALTNKIINDNSNSDIVKYQEANPLYNVLSGKNFEDEANSMGGMMSSIFGGSSTSYDSNMMAFGATSTPTSITIYPKDFDSKDKIIDILDQWNNTEVYKLYGNGKDSDGNYIADKYKITYTDISQLIISMLSSLINIITYALVAFSAISLVVSSIMISIITYASVIERTKEIGILRSLGSRKNDVSLVFIAEACIIGLVSACIALLSTLLINVIINIILGALAGVSNIASLSFTTAIWMIILSVGLNLIASIIPARMAAKKDPVAALRTE